MKMAASVAIEVCIDSVESAIAAVEVRRAQPSCAEPLKSLRLRRFVPMQQRVGRLRAGRALCQLGAGRDDAQRRYGEAAEVVLLVMAR